MDKKTGILSQIISNMAKSGPAQTGMIILILFGALYVSHLRSVEAEERYRKAEEKARNAVVQCYQKKSEETREMIKDNNEAQSEMIKAINELRHSINLLAEKFKKE